MPDEVVLSLVHKAPGIENARQIDRPTKAVAGVIHVVAAVVEVDGRYLVTRRQAGVHLAGLWEFPGGKVQAGESHARALEREMAEELAVESVTGSLVLETVHAYPEKTVTLYFYRSEVTGAPTPQQGQTVRWVSKQELRELNFPAADRDLIELLCSQ